MFGTRDEFRDRETNSPLLESIAELPAKRGEAGKLMPPLPELPEDAEKAELTLGPQLAVNPFRRDLPQAVASQDIWPWLVVAASCCFLRRCVRPPSANRFTMARSVLDAACRHRVAARTASRKAPETMSRLRSRKAEVDRSIESRRAATRFEPDAATPVDPNAAAAAEATQATTAPHLRRPPNQLLKPRQKKILHRAC